MSDNFRYRPGLNSVGNYQVSGIPFVTGNLSINGNTTAPVVITFPSVTQRIHVHNNDATNALRVGFSAAGVSGSGASNYWLVENHANNGKNNDYIELRVKTNKIYLISNTTSAVSGVFVAAELTGITTVDVGFDLVASYSGSVGIG
jgi:hypothetical protein